MTISNYLEDISLSKEYGTPKIADYIYKRLMVCWNAECFEEKTLFVKTFLECTMQECPL